MDRAVNFPLDKKVIDSLHVLVFTSVGGTQDGTDTCSPQSEVHIDQAVREVTLPIVFSSTRLTASSGSMTYLDSVQ